MSQTATKYKSVYVNKDKKLTCGLAMCEDIPSFLISKSQLFHLHCS